MQKVAVIGGAGFLGSNIVSDLVRKGQDVTVIDNFSSGTMANLQRSGAGVKIVKGDLKDYNFARDALRGFGMVYHFAAEVGNVAFLHGSAGRELASMQSNITIDTNVFRSCMENEIGKIIYPSSVAVYPTLEKFRSEGPLRRRMPTPMSSLKEDTDGPSTLPRSNWV